MSLYFWDMIENFKEKLVLTGELNPRAMGLRRRDNQILINRICCKPEQKCRIWRIRENLIYIYPWCPYHWMILDFVPHHYNCHFLFHSCQIHFPEENHQYSLLNNLLNCHDVDLVTIYLFSNKLSRFKKARFMPKNQHTNQGNTNLDHSHTLKSLIEEQTRINEQGGKKIPPFLLFFTE